MSDTAPQEQPQQRLQVGRLEEGLVPPNLIRPVMEIKTVKPDEGKGMVPPPVVRPPTSTQPPVPAPSTSPVSGKKPSTVQSKPPHPEK